MIMIIIIIIITTTIIIIIIITILTIITITAILTIITIIITIITILTILTIVIIILTITTIIMIIRIIILNSHSQIKTFLAEKGFGFIDCVTSIEGDIFFSKNELPSDLAEAKELRGKSVQFEITMGKAYQPQNLPKAQAFQVCKEMVERAMSAAPRPQGTQATGTVKSYSERRDLSDGSTRPDGEEIKALTMLLHHVDTEISKPSSMKRPNTQNFSETATARSNGYGFLALQTPAASYPNPDDQTTQRDAQFKGHSFSFHCHYEAYTQGPGSDLSPGLQALGWGLVGVEVQCQVHQLPDGKLKEAKAGTRTSRSTLMSRNLDIATGF
ncbi:hypothetical protein AK812_SmicGene41404 [Symbiodinium microadriaticum]|uniref:Uncharacterized protein n=1 Tax=Symbiodinium microadriaticum TaxID=2951 RepID=A0A1Q9C666_SYMMI|nr:hypothetical protein AK812_SmicGene41404 [Symbiodinium microadriaticum]